MMTALDVCVSNARVCLVIQTATVYVPIDAHCASADLRVRVYLKKKCKKKKNKKKIKKKKKKKN